MSAPLVELEQIHKRFGGRTVLDGISLSVCAGEMVALVGASGCGKTTLLNIIGALDVDFEGQARLLQQSLRALDDDGRTALRNERVGFVFQAFHLLEHFTVEQNVQVPLWLAGAKHRAEEERARAGEALSWVGLADRAQESVRPLSGGERQRVAIARAVVNHPTLLLADEPTGNLDRETGRSIYALFRRFKAEPRGAAVVVATHDVELAREADRVLSLSAGRIAEQGR